MNAKASILGTLLLLPLPALAGGGKPATLLGLSTDFDAGKVTFEVASSGCTSKADFRAELAGGTLTLVRERTDTCKAMPFRTKIEFTLKELGLSPHQPFRLGNELVVNEGISPR